MGQVDDNKYRHPFRSLENFFELFKVEECASCENAYQYNCDAQAVFTHRFEMLNFIQKLMDLILVRIFSNSRRSITFVLSSNFCGNQVGTGRLRSCGEYFNLWGVNVLVLFDCFFSSFKFFAHILTRCLLLSL